MLLEKIKDCNAKLWNFYTEITLSMGTNATALSSVIITNLGTWQLGMISTCVFVSLVVVWVLYNLYRTGQWGK